MITKWPIFSLKWQEPTFPSQELSKGVGIWNEALEVNMQKQVGGCEYLNCYASVWHRAALPTISSSSLKAHSNLTALCTFASPFLSPLESYLSSRHRSSSFYNFWVFNAVPHSGYSWVPLKSLQLQYQHSRYDSCCVSLFLLQSASSGSLITEAEPFDFWTSRLHAIIPFKHFLEVCGK